MHNIIAVNTSTLSSDIETMQTQLNAVKKAAGKMYDSVNVLNSMWEGPAHDAFVTQFMTDQKDMLALCDTIQKINVMSEARNEYNTCENQVSGIVASIRI